TAAHTLTQSDVDAGTYNNTATVTGKTPAGADVTDVSGTTETNDTPTVATITPAGSVTLVKTINGSVPMVVGGALNYNLVIKNTGNVTLNNLVVTDANAIVTGSPVSTLAPGASVTLGAAHTLTQGDVDAGTYSNTATVTGKTPAGSDVTDVSGTTETNDTPTLATITPVGAVTLVKTVNGSVPTAVGGALNYNLVIKNIGNVTLTNLVITDVNAIVTGSPVSSLDPGTSVTLTASHTLTQADIDAGTYSNTATVTGQTPAGADVTDVSGTTETNDTPTVATITPAGAVTLVKTVNGTVPNKTGEVLSYNLVVKNTGNVTLTNLMVTDANAIVTGSPVSTLAPRASVTLTASHTLTQGDVDAGTYSNTATVTGKTPAGADVTDVSGTTETNDTPTVATITPAGSVTLMKTINGSVPTVVGGVLNYNLIIKNTGNVTITNLVVTDANAVVTGSPVSTLAPGASVTLGAAHTLTQVDVDAGNYTNTATVTGKTPAGSDVTDVSGTTETNDTPTLATITPAGSVTLVKTINGSIPTVVGGVLNYDLIIKNTGNVTLINLVITDANAVLTGSPVSSLAPGAILTLTAVHTLTQADIDAGAYSNTASVTGKTPAGADVTDVSGTTETNDTPTVAMITSAGAVTLVKTINGSVPTAVGGVLNYNLTIKNTGNVTLNNLVVTDVNAIVTGSPVSSLAPGTSVTLTASHTLTQADIDAGTYSNTATVTGQRPAGLDVTDVSGTTEANDTPTVATITPAGSVTLIKTINGSVPTVVGGVLNYNLIIKNTGNVTLTNLVVTDANAVVTGSPVSSLAPGASVTLTAAHTLTQGDVDAGTYSNTATVTGKTPAGLDVIDVSGTTETNDTPTVATITPAGAVTLVKSVNG
ncbi:hypothetical protein, partial [Pedobacter sp. BMA]|uniref:beta strand repeat-containing protein n=1 Tax=Pedobacter sp. BMA TaxID=1663685 RepID=UPI00064AC650